MILGLKEKNRAFHSKNMRNLNSTGGSGVGSGIFISVFVMVTGLSGVQFVL